MAADLPCLADLASPHFSLGTAIDLRDLAPGPLDLLTSHFRSVTFENAMKPAWAQPREGEFRFEGADRLIESLDDDQRVYGHTFVWHHQTPAWLFQHDDGTPLTSAPADAAILRGRLRRHITTMAEHFGERVWAWEVVNEAVDETEPDLMRRTPWFDILGPDYIAEAFAMAREAAPHAMLVINDFETERPDKRDAYVEVVSRLLAAGVEFDAVGHQAHLNLSSSVAEMRATLEAFSRLGVRQAITELDVSTSRGGAEESPWPEDQRPEAQVELYGALFDLFREHADSIDVVTIWGLFDGHSWLRYWPEIRLHEAPLLFDDLLEPKGSFWSVASALQGSASGVRA